MTDHYPITVAVCVRDAVMLDELRAVSLRHRNRIQARITEAQTDLAAIDAGSVSRRTELDSIVAPIQQVPALDRATALTAAGLTVEQFQAVVLELDGLNGALSAAKNRIRRLESELGDMSVLDPA